MNKFVIMEDNLNSEEYFTEKDHTHDLGIKNK